MCGAHWTVTTSASAWDQPDKTQIQTRFCSFQTKCTTYIIQEEQTDVYSSDCGLRIFPVLEGELSSYFKEMVKIKSDFTLEQNFAYSQVPKSYTHRHVKFILKFLFPWTVSETLRINHPHLGPKNKIK